MIKALVQMANSEFADSGALLRVVQAIEDVKAETLVALDLEHVNEATSVAQFEAEVEEREEDNARLGREINILNGSIAATENRIAEKENFLAIRQQDLANFTAELEAEEAAFEEATTFYEDVRAELVREQAVGNDALAIVSNAGFSATLTGNINF
jgi:predicted  nucleic acid-binding Zn-ribbon protein